MKCATCGISVSKTPMFRSNEIGVPAIWKCRMCLSSPPPKDLEKTVDIINELGNGKIIKH